MDIDLVPFQDRLSDAVPDAADAINALDAEGLRSAIVAQLATGDGGDTPLWLFPATSIAAGDTITDPALRELIVDQDLQDRATDLVASVAGATAASSLTPDHRLLFAIDIVVLSLLGDDRSSSALSSLAPLIFELALSSTRAAAASTEAYSSGAEANLVPPAAPSAPHLVPPLDPGPLPPTNLVPTTGAVQPGAFSPSPPPSSGPSSSSVQFNGPLSADQLAAIVSSAVASALASSSVSPSPSRSSVPQLDLDAAAHDFDPDSEAPVFVSDQNTSSQFQYRASTRDIRSGRARSKFALLNGSELFGNAIFDWVLSLYGNDAGDENAALMYNQAVDETVGELKGRVLFLRDRGIVSDRNLGLFFYDRLLPHIKDEMRRSNVANEQSPFARLVEHAAIIERNMKTQHHSIHHVNAAVTSPTTPPPPPGTESSRSPPDVADPSDIVRTREAYLARFRQGRCFICGCQHVMNDCSARTPALVQQVQLVANSDRQATAPSTSPGQANHNETVTNDATPSTPTPSTAPPPTNVRERLEHLTASRPAAQVQAIIAEELGIYSEFNDALLYDHF